MRRVRTSSRSARATSLPSMSGRRRSSKMTSGSDSAASVRASRPSAASIVLRPPARSTSRASFRFLSLSSTMSTSGAFGGTDVITVCSSRGHQDRARRGPVPRSRGPQTAARGTGRARGRLRVWGPRVAARSGRGGAARRRRDGHSHAAGEPRRGDPGRHPAARDESGGRRRRAESVRLAGLPARPPSRVAASDGPTC